MSVQVTGINIDVGTAFKDHVLKKMNAVLDKYIGGEIYGHVRISKERGRFQTSCSVRLRTGLLVEASGDSADAYASADAALDRLEKRIRRYKRRLKNHHSEHKNVAYAQQPVSDYTVQLPDQDTETNDENVDPLIVAETERMIGELPVSEAVMQLDLTDDAFLVFRNAANGATNIVYRRSDGNVGWIDPAPTEN